VTRQRSTARPFPVSRFRGSDRASTCQKISDAFASGQTSVSVVGGNVEDGKWESVLSAQKLTSSSSERLFHPAFCDQSSHQTTITHDGKDNAHMRRPLSTRGKEGDPRERWRDVAQGSTRQQRTLSGYFEGADHAPVWRHKGPSYMHDACLKTSRDVRY